MKKYLKYYNILSLTTLTKRGFFYTLLFGLLNIIVYNKFISLTDMFTTGFGVMFIWALFAVIYYAYQVHTEQTHPMYQFPFDYKDRVVNSYINVFLIFLFIAIGLVLFGFTMVGLFTLFGDVQNDTVNDPFYIAGTIYSIGYSLLVFAAFMPASFITSIKRRYVQGFISIIGLIVFNYIIIWILTGNLTINTNMAINMEDTSYGLLLSIAVLFISVSALFISYSTSKKLSK